MVRPVHLSISIWDESTIGHVYFLRIYRSSFFPETPGFRTKNIVPTQTAKILTFKVCFFAFDMFVCDNVAFCFQPPQFLRTKPAIGSVMAWTPVFEQLRLLQDVARMEREVTSMILVWI